MFSSMRSEAVMYVEAARIFIDDKKIANGKSRWLFLHSQDLKNAISSLSFSAISLSPEADPARVVTVAESSCIEAPVSSEEAAFSSEIAERALMVSTTAFLEDSQVSAPSEMSLTPSTVLPISASIPLTASRVSPRAIC